MSIMSTDFEHTRWGFVYDGDQHIHEPRDFWYERLPSRYRDRAPRTVTGDDGKDYYQLCRRSDHGRSPTCERPSAG